MMLKLTNFLTRPIAAAAAIALLGLTLSSAQAATVPFSDDFNDTNLDDFAIVGNFVMNGTVLNYGGASHSRAAAELTNANGLDLVVTTTLATTTFGGTADAGLMLFANTASSDNLAYVADLKPTGAFRILRNFSTIASGVFTFDLADTYALTFTATPSGGSLDLAFTVDPSSSAAVTISVTDATPLTGSYFGLRVNPAAMTTALTFDDFSVTAIPEPASLALMALGLVGMVSLRKRNRC